MRRIIVAPFANNDLREWPLPLYAGLIDLLLQQADIEVIVVGTAAQRARAESLTRAHAPRAANRCGEINWETLGSLCAVADCVVGNNSGVTHLAAHLGAKTVCVFGGSNDRAEWGAQGERVTLISRQIACAPCHLSRATDCAHELACLQGITPPEVAAVILAP